MDKDCKKPDFPLLRGFRPFLLLLLVFALFLAYTILEPFLHTIIIAIILASLFNPLNVWLTRKWHGRRNLASLAVCACITVVIILPLFLFVSALISQGLTTMNAISEWIDAGEYEKLQSDQRLLDVLAWIDANLGFVELSKIDFQGTILSASKAAGQFLLSTGAGAARNVAGILANFFIMLFVLFYLVRDGRDMVNNLMYLSPLRSHQERRIVSRMRDVARSAILGNFITALLQGIAGGIGFAIVGIPAFFWGAVLGFASFIPVVGTALVWIPAVVYLLLMGDWKWAIFLALWSAIVVGSIDNFLRPFFMRGGAQMSPFYIFLAILGGVSVFGLAGIIYGPLIIAFATVMVYIYKMEYKDLLDESEADDDIAQVKES